MQELFSLFEEMGYGDLYFRQGSLANKEYPTSFFTFWNYDTPSIKDRDNKSKEHTENIMVYFYTNNASLVYSVMNDFIKRANQKGFIVQGKAHDAPSDEDNYFGRLVRIRILHKEED